MQHNAILRFFDRYLGIPLLIFFSMFKRRKRLPIQNIKKIMVLKFAAIGDSLLLIPMLRLLRNSFPQSEITFVCTHINKSVIDKIPYINKNICLDLYSFIVNPMSFIKMIFTLRKVKYDIIIDAEQWSRFSSLIIALIRREWSVGYKIKKQHKHYIYDSVVMHQRDEHEIISFLNLLLPLGVTYSEKDYWLEYFLSKENMEFAGKYFKENGLEDKYVISVHPGCGSNGEAREWSEDKYIALGRKLIEYNKDIRIILTGAKIEYEKCERIEKGIGKNVINTAGKYKLDDVIALMKLTKFLICGNTGMLHFATGVGVKTFGLHGPTNPVKWRAYSDKAVLIQSDIYCSPCLYLGHDFGCNDPVCMDRILVEDVYIKVLNSIKSDNIPVDKN
jgi:ADP-heptose:LPS heptosyltransferase